MPPVDPTHVLITGASSGIGAALAVRCARAGTRLTLLGRDATRLAETAERCGIAGANVDTHICDVRDTAAMRAAVQSADDRTPVTAVIANAGIGGSAVLAPLAGETAESVREIFDVNLMGAINAIAPLQDRFVARRRGQIVLVSSMAAFEGLADAPAYSASKAAVRIYGHGLRRLLAPHGVAVSIVVPGFVATPMSASLPVAKPFEWTADKAARRILRGLNRNEAEIAFPWQMKVGAALASMLPLFAVDKILARAGTRLEGRS